MIKGAKSRFRIVRLIMMMGFFALYLSDCSQERANQFVPLDFALMQNGCDASVCHGSSPLTEYPSTSGRHTLHLNHASISQTTSACDSCHWNYENDPLHRNGFSDGYDARTGLHNGESIVNFGGLSGARTSVPVTASFKPTSGRCNDISCHNNADNIAWYEENEICLTCHGNGSIVDPNYTNGEGTAGKHIIHVVDRGFSCSNCHDGYKETSNHFNGRLESADADGQLALFDDNNPNGNWSNDTGSDSGGCSDLSCHSGAQ